jgi:phosphate/sulfate permease
MLLSPVTPSFRMIKNENHKLILRVFAILISCIWISAANYCGLSYSVASAALCAISIANYQLIVPVMTSLFLNNSKRREEK